MRGTLSVTERVKCEGGEFHELLTCTGHERGGSDVVLLSGGGDGERGAGQLLGAGGQGGGGSGEAEGGGHRGRHSCPALGNAIQRNATQRFLGNATLLPSPREEEIERAEWIRREKPLSLSPR